MFRRVPMFFKFLAGCLMLAFILILGGSIILHAESQRSVRINYLERHFRYYLAFQDSVATTVGTAADLLATVPEIADGLQRLAAERDGATGAAPGPAGAIDVPAAATASTDSAAGALAAAAEDRFEVLQAGPLSPEIVYVFDASGARVWGNQGGVADPEALRQTQLVKGVLDGNAYYDKALIEGGRAYLVVAVPVHARGDGRSDGGRGRAGRVVGGVLVGVALDRVMNRYRQIWDARASSQQFLVMLHRGRVVASAFPPERSDELSRMLSREDWVQTDEKGEFRPTFVKLSDAEYQVYAGEGGNADVEGFSGLESGVVGKLHLLRLRRDFEGTEAKIPWLEIAIGIGLSFLVASVLAVWITRPIKRFVVQSRQMLEGETDLTQRIELSSRDETQALAKNINQVFARLYELAGEVQGAAFRVGASSAEISAASKQMLAGLKDQTLKIEGSTAAVTELSASIQQVAANAAEATSAAEKSNVAVTSAVDRMQQIRDAVDEAAGKMHELGESSKRIGNIVEVIRQISEQTSLLALNASIEAAHAGEQGRGFAVVADEVSSLARRVGQSAKDIESLIGTIKEQTAEAMTSMQVGTREVEGGTQLVTDTLTDLRNLIDVVKDTATAVQEQAVVSDEIARNMDAVQRIASEVLTGSEESVIQAEQLHELAFALERSIAGFNLDGGGRRVSGARGFDADDPRAGGLSGTRTGSRGQAAPRQLPAAGRDVPGAQRDLNDSAGTDRE